MSVTARGAHTQIYDLGQNMVGRVRLRVRAPRGTEIRLRHAERLNDDGSLDTRSLRAARATDTYIPRGDGVEVWEPRFTYHGFRYVEASGQQTPLPLDAVTGVVIGADLPDAGSFQCSNELVNRIFAATSWTQRGNYMEVPTDCPQRDERLGWGGDNAMFKIGRAHV